jgi:hypothetical protein
MKILKLNQDMFDNIHIDAIYMYCGKHKIRLESGSIYNQFVDYLSSNSPKLLNQFVAWFYVKNNIPSNVDVPDEVIASWENNLRNRSRSMIYIEAFRIMYKPNNVIEFYGVIEGSRITYITSTDSANYFSKLIQYLHYNPACDVLYDKYGIEHCLEKPDIVIKNEIRLALRYKLIPKIDKIKVISNSSCAIKDNYCLAYYDLNCGNKNKPTPAWDNFIITIPNNGSRECFRAWVYSLFKDDNFGRQVLWLFGRGNTGKSKIAETLASKLSSLNPLIVSNLIDAFLADKFSSASYVNKRLIKAPDTKDRALIRTQDVKNITGNDSRAVRRMHQEEASYNVYAKIIATSNFRPWVDPSKEEEISRCLYICIDSKSAYEAYHNWDSKVNGDWGLALYEEMDNFIAKCKDDYYATLQPDGHNIVPYSQMIEMLLKGDYYIRRDMKLWWENCVQPFIIKKGDKRLTSVLTTVEMVDDFNRFVYPANRNGDKNSLIRSFLITHIRGLSIPIYDLEAGNYQYIKGWEFKKNKNMMNISMISIIDGIKDKVEKEGLEHDEIYS